MGLRLKFNLVLVIVFLAGFAATGLVSRQLLQDNAREEVLRNARLMMDTALSVRLYRRAGQAAPGQAAPGRVSAANRAGLCRH